ncbi:MAG: kynureninase [Gaiellaceae bacterium]
MAAVERAHAEALDAADPLAPFRDRFVLEDGDRIYVDGNSLGRLPRETAELLAARVEEWGRRLVTAWPDWLDLPLEVGDVLAPLVGARPGEVLVADSTTVNLYKLAHAALDVREGAIVARAGEFPTNRYVLQGLAAQRGRELRLVDDVRSALAPPVALACLSHVDYRTGALEDMVAVTAAAHDAGALALWDLSHSAGAVPVGLDAAGADLAVGCTYKYLNAGPGAPAFLYVRSELQERLRSPIWGWFAQRDQFAMGPEYDPVAGIGRFQAGTPSVLGLAAVEAGARLLAEARIERLREKSVALTSLVVDLHDAWLAPLGFALGTPRRPDQRGAHVSLRHPDGWRICRALIERANVVPDFRGPDSVRYGLPPVYTRFVDAWDAVDRLRRLVEEGVHLEVEPGTARVT